MGRSVGTVPTKGSGGYSSDLFYGGAGRPKPSPLPDQRAFPGGPILPHNPYAQMAWTSQYLKGAMNTPASTSQGWQGRLANPPKIK